MEPSAAEEFQCYLRPTRFIDSDAPTVIQFAQAAVGPETTDAGRATRLFYAVRDTIVYDPYRIDLHPAAVRASTILEQKYGFCVTKAILLAALARVVGIPSRLGFADVKHYQSPPKLLELMGTDVFFHGYAELFIGQRWVKATPAHNLGLCERFDIVPVEFDGTSDAVFHPHDRQGRPHTEYLRYHGTYADLPYEQIIGICRQYYPNWFGEKGG